MYVGSIVQLGHITPQDLTMSSFPLTTPAYYKIHEVQQNHIEFICNSSNTDCLVIWILMNRCVFYGYKAMPNGEVNGSLFLPDFFGEGSAYTLG